MIPYRFKWLDFYIFLSLKKKKKDIPEKEELIKSYIFDGGDAVLQTNYSVQKVWETEKKCTMYNTKFACQGFFSLLLLLVSFYFILKADVCSDLLHYRRLQIQEYWFTTSIITWQMQPLLSESWSITGISNFHKSQQINPEVKSFSHRKQFSEISKYFYKERQK